ncbi:tail fiber domain-containing protein [bacterium]|nr:tail fiber domain-containing protein [bacterium]
MRKLNGFSLMEAMVVMLIVAVLAAVSAPMVNKRLLSELAEKQPWVYVDDKENIAFNLKASDAMTAMIGASTTPSDYNPKLYLKTDNSNKHPHITFGDKNNNTLNLFATDGNIWFSNSAPFDSSNKAVATNSVVLGKVANASANNTVSIGYSANATANDTVAIGKSANANKEGGIAIGAYAKAAANGAMALGGQTADNDAIVIGYSLKSNKATGTFDYIRIGGEKDEQYDSSANSIAIGRNIDAKMNSIALGNNFVASKNSIGIIKNNQDSDDTNKTFTLGEDSIAIGRIYDLEDNVTTGKSSVSIGSIAISSGNSAVALGSARSEGDSSIAIGWKALTKNYASVAIGANSTSAANNSIAIGNSANTTQPSSIALGINSATKNENAIAIGSNATASGTNSIAIGYNATASGANSIAIGVGVTSSSQNRVVLGNSNSLVYIPGKLEVGGNVVLNKSDTKARTKVRLSKKDSHDGNALYTLYRNNQSNVGWTTDDQSDYSDRRLKNIGKAFTGGLEEIKKLEVFNYTFKKDKEKTPRVGIMAQDLQKIFPQAVFKGEDGFLRIRMEDMFYSLVNAIKELDKKIEKLKINDIFTLKNRIENLKNENQTLEKRLNELEKKINNL